MINFRWFDKEDNLEDYKESSFPDDLVEDYLRHVIQLQKEHPESDFGVLFNNRLMFYAICYFIKEKELDYTKVKFCLKNRSFDFDSNGQIIKINPEDELFFFDNFEKKDPVKKFLSVFK